MSIVTLSICFFACTRERKKENIAWLVTEWQGKEIVFPENQVFTRYLTDTTDYRALESEYKVLIYI
jgi:hypothetical protein